MSSFIKLTRINCENSPAKPVKICNLPLMYSGIDLKQLMYETCIESIKMAHSLIQTVEL